jgi:GT2 family glycosyltransferase
VGVIADEDWVSAVTPMRIAVVIPTWDGWPLLDACLEALFAQTRLPDQVVVVDNGSVDGTLERLAAGFPEVLVVPFATNTGFARAVNAGIAASSGDSVVLLNNDAQPDPTWLEELEDIASTAEPTVGFVTSKIVDAQGLLIESVGDLVDRAGVPHQSGHGQPEGSVPGFAREVFSGCGGATLYRRSMLADIGEFDERFFAYYEDVDLCFRAQLLGYRGLVAPAARVRHVGSVTSARVPGMKTRLSTRNGWWLVIKNAPPSLLAPMLVQLAAVNAVRLLFAAREGLTELKAALQGHGQALRGLRWVIADRRRVQARRVMTARELRRRLPRARLMVRGWAMLGRFLTRDKPVSAEPSLEVAP